MIAFLNQLVAYVELLVILGVGGLAWLMVFGPRTVRRAVRAWIGSRPDRDDRMFEQWRRAKEQEAREAFKRESHTA